MVFESKQFKSAGVPYAWLLLGWFQGVSSDLNLVPNISTLGFGPLLRSFLLPGGRPETKSFPDFDLKLNRVCNRTVQ